MKKVVLYSIFILLAQTLMADHGKGFYLRYKYLGIVSGNMKFKVNLDWLRDCKGITISGAQIEAYCSNGCAGTNLGSFPLTLVSAKNVSQVCDTALTQCDINNQAPSSALNGTLLLSFQADILIPVSQCASNSQSITFSYSSAARSGLLANMAANSFGVWSKSLNRNIFPNNTSPEISGRSAPYIYQSPIDTVCFSPGFTDNEGDSLVFSLTAPKVPGGSGPSAPNDCFPNADVGALGYSPGFSATQPFGAGVYTFLDPLTGTINFKPTTGGLYAIAYKIDEYRNNPATGLPVKIGEYIYEYTLTVVIPVPGTPVLNVRCGLLPNINPQLITNDFSACSGSDVTITYKINTAPGAALPTIVSENLSSNTDVSNLNISLIPNATGFDAQIILNPKIKRFGTVIIGYNIPINIVLRAPCTPGTIVPVEITLSGNLKVKASISSFPFKPAPFDTTLCQGDSIKIGVFGNGPYKWSIINGDTSSIRKFLTTGKDSLWIRPLEYTRYLVIDTSNLSAIGCKKQDTISVRLVPSFSNFMTINPDNNCSGLKYLLSDSAIIPPFFGNNQPFKYIWSRPNSPNDTLEYLNHRLQRPTFLPRRAGVQCVAVQSRKFHCQKTDSLCFHVRFNYPISALVKTNTNLYCKGDTVKLNADAFPKCEVVKPCSKVSTNEILNAAALTTFELNAPNPFKFSGGPKKKTQFILKKSELINQQIFIDTRIDRLSFELSDVAGPLNNREVYIDSIRVNCFVGTYALNAPTDSFKSAPFVVFKRDLQKKDVLKRDTLKIVNGLNTIFFDNAFRYDGKGDLIIEFYTSVNTNAANPLIKIKSYTDATNNLTIVSNGNALVGSVSKSRPSVVLGYCNHYGPLTYTWNPDTIIGSPNLFTYSNPNLKNPAILTLNGTNDSLQSVLYTIKDDSSACIKTQKALIKIIRPYTTIGIIGDAIRKDTTCTGAAFNLNTNLSTQARYGVKWNYIDPLNGQSFAIPNKINNSADVIPSLSGNSPKVISYFSRIFVKNNISSTNANQCALDSVQFLVYPNAKLVASQNTFSKCPNQSKTIVTSVKGFWKFKDFDSLAYQLVWDTSNTFLTYSGLRNNTITVSNSITDTFFFKIVSQASCVDSIITYPVIINIPFIDSLNLDITKSEFDRCAEKPIPLTGLITGKTSTVKPEDYNFSWFVQQVNSSGTAIGTPQFMTNTKDATYSFPTSGNYKITYIATDSCEYRPDTLSEIVLIDKCNIPNIFTPNGDADNQYFAINFAIGQSAKLKIFDRWGKEVYANENYTCSYGEKAIDPANTCFTGSNLNDGTYFYTLDIPNDKKYQGYVQIVNNK